MGKKNFKLQSVESAGKDPGAGHIVCLHYKDGIEGRITFLEEDIFRYDVDPEGVFAEYATPREKEHTARIQQWPDEADAYTKPEAELLEKEGELIIRCGETAVIIAKDTAKMRICVKGRKVMEEAEALTVTEDAAIQTLVKGADENFYGGGTQNGRFVHTGKRIEIVNESGWMDGGVASPNPFYLSTAGYGVLRNTFSEGSYDFGETDENIVTAEHKENRLSAYYFLADAGNGRETIQKILQGYFHVTGNPLLLPEYGFYEGHLNCYNRDGWSEESGDKAWNVKGSSSCSSDGRTRYESGMATGYRFTDHQHAESLNGKRPCVSIENYPETVDTPYEYSARAVLDEYVHYDMPLGFFLPNDGYGGGYGQNGYYKQGGVNEDGSSSQERLAAIDANVRNLTEFTEYAGSKGVASGLWTESQLVPDSNSETYWHLLRDFRKEVTVGGATTLKTDVAWVGPGYSFQLNGVKRAYDVVTTSRNFRPNIISLDGWAGSQRFNSVWSGDQTGGNWEYIRFHIPTYIGSSLSGNPNIGSDMDGIFGGRAQIAVRDYQWKAFTPQMLNMDGWGNYMKAPYTFGDPYTGISRMYMKIKARLMPYIYTCAVSASNIDTGNGDTGLPMVRAMFLEYPEDFYAYSREMQYQFMLGADILVAPVYKDIAADEMGNDVRNRIYLPDENAVWIDYLTGEKYQGGQVLNNFEAPIWKLPVFVKAGTILPMYEENNTPEEVDRTKRFIEFWPLGSSRYSVYEDDGKYVCNCTREDEAYGTIDHISYGDHVSATYTSVVEGDRAVLTAEPLLGSYRGYERNRSTTFIVHLSQRPRAVQAKNGERLLSMRELERREDFEQAIPGEGEAVFFYEEEPGIHTYAPEEEAEIRKLTMDIKGTPKLYVKLAPVDAAAERQVLEIMGFADEFIPPVNKENASLGVPQLRALEEKKTASAIWLAWTEVPEAASYEMLVDGRLYTMGRACSYLHDELAYQSEHTYCVRARNEKGYSRWSSRLTVSTLNDPWRNEIGAGSAITWTGGDEAGALKYAIDHSFRGLFFAADDVVKDKIPFIYDFKAVYELDRFEYYPRDNYGSGTVYRMNVYSSLDGVHWRMEWNGEEKEDWEYDDRLEVEENGKTVSLDGVSARYLKLEIAKSRKNFFASHELSVYKKEGTRPFALGSTNKNETVSEGDYINMKNYLGTSIRDGANFIDQIQKRCGDINGNGIYDVYDYAYTMSALDGGTKQKGAVSGSISLVPEAETVGAGEIFTIGVMAEDVENLNAFGKVLDYDPARLDFVSVVPDESIMQMENLTVNKRYGDGTAYLNLAFANRGDQKLYDGSGRLAVITMKALTEIRPQDEMACSGIWLIGPELDIR